MQVGVLCHDEPLHAMYGDGWILVDVLGGCALQNRCAPISFLFYYSTDIDPSNEQCAHSMHTRTYTTTCRYAFLLPDTQIAPSGYETLEALKVVAASVASREGNTGTSQTGAGGDATGSGAGAGAGGFGAASDRAGVFAASAGVRTTSMSRRLVGGCWCWAAVIYITGAVLLC